MTAGDGKVGQQAQLHDYELIDRARRAVPRLASGSLDRIAEVVARALAGEGPTDAALEELARALDGGS